MKAGMYWAGVLIVGGVLGAVMAALGVSGPAALAVFVVGAILFARTDRQARHAATENSGTAR